MDYYPYFRVFPGTPGPQSSQAPTAPPPSFTPQQSPSTFAIDAGSIRMCRNRNTFVWLTNGERFWYYPVLIGPDSTSGFRWNGRFWMIFAINLRRISSFTCF